MQASLLTAMRARRPSIRTRWVDLLRAEPVTTPLANPDTLVHLIDETLEEVFAVLAAMHEADCVAAAVMARAHCECGRNPLLAYFLAGEQALLEALVLAQVDTPGLTPTDRGTSVAALSVTVRTLARGEIESFCALCQHRTGKVPGSAGSGAPAI